MSVGDIRILVVDDHPVVRAGLRGIIEAKAGFDVVGEAVDGNAAVRQAHDLLPDAVLMDLRMPGGDGVDAIPWITVEFPGAHVLVLTTYDSDTDILRGRGGGTRLPAEGHPARGTLPGDPVGSGGPIGVGAVGGGPSDGPDACPRGGTAQFTWARCSPLGRSGGEQP